jgi:hypothetical protein
MAQSGFSGRATNGINATGASDGGDVLLIERASFASSRSSICPEAVAPPADGFPIVSDS